MNRVERRIMKELEQNSWNDVDGSELEIPKGSVLDLMRRDGRTYNKIKESIVEWQELKLPSDIVKWRYNAEVYHQKEKPEFHGDFSNMTEDQQEAVINPSHYKLIPSEAYEKFTDGLEYMNLMEYILSHHNGVEAHLLGQIFKYAVRLGKKDDDLQDAKKIQWYANYLVNVIKERNA